MGQLDFEYGHNVKTDVPSYSKACMGMMVCPHCGKAAICGDIEAISVPPITGGTMDLKGQRSNRDTSTKFENRDFITAEDLPKKGASKWKIETVRDAKANKFKTLLYMDIRSGTKKRVMSLKKGFTLDMFIDELGTQSEKWVGKSISLERGGSEGQYVNVSR